MQEFITALLTAVITAAVPVITVYAVNALKKAGANAEADTEDIKVKGYVKEQLRGETMFMPISWEEDKV